MIIRSMIFFVVSLIFAFASFFFAYINNHIHAAVISPIAIIIISLLYIKLYIFKDSIEKIQKDIFFHIYLKKLIQYGKIAKYSRQESLSFFEKDVHSEIQKEFNLKTVQDLYNFIMVYYSGFDYMISLLCKHNPEYAISLISLMSINEKDLESYNPFEILKNVENTGINPNSNLKIRFKKQIWEEDI